MFAWAGDTFPTPTRKRTMRSTSDKEDIILKIMCFVGAGISIVSFGFADAPTQGWIFFAFLGWCVALLQSARLDK